MTSAAVDDAPDPVAAGQVGAFTFHVTDPNARLYDISCRVNPGLRRGSRRRHAAHPAQLINLSVSPEKPVQPENFAQKRRSEPCANPKKESANSATTDKKRILIPLAGVIHRLLQECRG